MTRKDFWKLCGEVKADENTIVEGYPNLAYFGGGYSCWSFISLYPSLSFVRRYLDVSKDKFEREVAKYKRWLAAYVKDSEK